MPGSIVIEKCPSGKIREYLDIQTVLINLLGDLFNSLQHLYWAA